MHAEMVDMHLVYGPVNGKGRATVREYRQRFPIRRFLNTKHSDVCIACYVKQALSMQVCMILVGIEQCELLKYKRRDFATC